MAAGKAKDSPVAEGRDPCLGCDGSGFIARYTFRRVGEGEAVALAYDRSDDQVSCPRCGGHGYTVGGLPPVPSRSRGPRPQPPARPAVDRFSPKRPGRPPASGKAQ